MKPNSHRRRVHCTLSCMKIDCCHVACYISEMIKTFADKDTEELFCEGASKRVPPNVQARTTRKLDMLDAAISIADLRVPPGNRLPALRGDREGQHAIAINDQWRICFRFDHDDVYDVEICDYH